MTPFSRKTRKLYYECPLLNEHRARIVKKGADFIELDETIAYPEGGGQDSDRGEIVLPSGAALHFFHARKLYGNNPPFAGAPDILVDGVIEHKIAAEDLCHLTAAAVGDSVIIRIDPVRRAWHSLSHTASHLLFLGIAEVRPDLTPHTIGCHIGMASARFDFASTKRITLDEVAAVTAIANAYIHRDSEVQTYADENHSDVRYWSCEGKIIPCGGTHIESAGPVRAIEVRRKSMGKGKERISCTFPLAQVHIPGYVGGQGI